MEDDHTKDFGDFAANNAASDPDKDGSNGASPPSPARGDSENMFAESPVYDLDTEELGQAAHRVHILHEETSTDAEDAVENQENPSKEPIKRKLSDSDDKSLKVQKLEPMATGAVDTQVLDDEVSKINVAAGKRKLLEETPSTSKILGPVRSSPRKIVKRSNSCSCCDNVTTRTPRARCASMDPHTPAEAHAATFCSPSTGDTRDSRPSVEFVREIRSASKAPFNTIREEESSMDPNDSQNFHLKLSPNTPSDKEVTSEKHDLNSEHCSESVLVTDRTDIDYPGCAHNPRTLGYNFDSNHGYSQSLLTSYHKSKLSAERTTDQDSTDSVNSLVLDSPDPPASLTSKIITKLSNGDSSTPTELAAPKHTITISDNEDSTPDSNKNGVVPKRFPVKNESFRISNSTTPSTISPLQNGHTFPLHTPTNPSFDIHIGHDEDGEFLSMYVVRTDNDLGQDMCKEFQRVSKRFTMDPYLADVSKSSSPSSVTSGSGMTQLPLPLPHPARSSFTSTVSSSTSGASNRTSDGAFIVPQPPGKALSHHGTTTVRGYRALLKKIHDIFSHFPDATEDANRSDDKVSVDVQVSPGLGEEKRSNGSASPDEIGRCDRATPKSSLKKTKVKGRRPLTGKTKRALLPTQTEEPEYMHGMNSPEMIPSCGEKESKPEPVARESNDRITAPSTPKSISKLKERRRGRPESPRPVTPLDAPHEPPAHAPGTPVLAKWVDKRYYSGRVVEMLEPGKYQIEFDDGHTKVLLEEFIIFGSGRELPLEGQSVYAMVDDEQSYEPGLVLAVEQNSHDTVLYRCTTDREACVSVTASELYMTEDQARALKESCAPGGAGGGTPGAGTPRRRLRRELDLDNIIHGPRSARARDKGCSARKRLTSPKSPKASTSGLKGRATTPVTGRKQRQVSESSEMSEGSNSGAAASVAAAGEEVPGVEPEVQRTPRKIDGVTAGPLQLKGAAKQTTGKKNSKLSKFENDAETVLLLGPIPEIGSELFRELHFLLTCTDRPPPRPTLTSAATDAAQGSSSDETGGSSTEHEGREFSKQPYDKERLRAQLEAGGGVVHSRLQDVPTNKYSSTRLIASRPCYTAKYIECLAADIRAVSHGWVIASCSQRRLCDEDSFALPAGWSIRRQCFIPWRGAGGRRGGVFKDKLVLLCGDERFSKFWERVCSLVGAHTRLVNEESPELAGGLAVLTDSDCPHEVQNQAGQEGVPLVSPTWVVQCLVEGRVCPPASHVRFSFMYADAD